MKVDVELGRHMIALGGNLGCCVLGESFSLSLRGARSLCATDDPRFKIMLIFEIFKFFQNFQSIFRAQNCSKAVPIGFFKVKFVLCLFVDNKVFH